MSKRNHLGDEVVTYCGRCKEERTHQVEALAAANRIERVTCRFCHSNHLYRAPRQSETGVAVSKRVRSAAAPKTARRAASLKPARAYSSQETYEIGDQIAHPKFGQGEVVEVRPGKVGVRFGRELRTLLQASQIGA